MKSRLATIAAVLSLLLGVASLRAQAPAGPGAVLGTVTSEAGPPLAGAAVVVRPANDTVVVARGAADGEGRFRVGGLAPGRYAVTVTHPGFAPRVGADVELTAEAPVRDLGTVRLGASPLALEGLEVRAERAPVAVAPDRTLYSTKDMPVAAGGSATDVLRNVPELEVDLDGKVTLQGNAAVTIHLNGRPAPIRGEGLGTFLQQFPASRIERIEVIPNPSARHDPEGSAGIVNIVLKDNVDLGLSGTLSVNGGTRGNGGGSGRLAYQRGPLTVFGGSSGTLSRRRSTSYDLRQNLAGREVTFHEQELSSLNRGAFGMMDLSVEFRVGRHGTLFSSLSGFANGSDSEGASVYAIMDSAQAPVLRYDRQTGNDWRGRTTDYGLGFRFAPRPQQHEFSVELRSNGWDNDSEGRWLQETFTAAGDPADRPLELTLNGSDVADRTHSLQADYVRPLGAEGKLEAGYRASLRTSSNDDVMRVFSPAEAVEPARGVESGYTYGEDTHSLYVTLGGRAGKVGFQGGLRAEHASTEFSARPGGQGFDDTYRSLYPSAHLSYDLGQGRQARVTYSKRIERPWPFFLNPFVPAPDSLNRTVGNPDLRPKYTHSVTGDLSWTAPFGTVRMSPYYRLTVDNWEQMKRVDSAGVSTLTWENLASIRSYGTTVTASLRPTGRVSGFASVSGYREVRDAGDLGSEFSRDVLRWSASANGTFRITSALNVQSMVRYSPPREMPQGRYSATFMSSVGARQELWGKKAWVNVSITDPFDLWRFNFETFDRTHQQISRNSWGMRMATASFTYSFGRPPQQTVRRSTEMAAPPQEPTMH